MDKKNRVFITGLSALTASGNTADETWAAIKAGENGLEEIKHWDLSSWPCRIGGELKDFKPAKMLPEKKLLKVISRHDVMGINAAMQAVEHSQLLTYRNQLETPALFNDKTAVYVGSPGNKYYQQYDFLPLLAKTENNMQAFAQQLFSEVHPMWLLRILPNNVLAYTGITYQFKGPNHNITNHAVGGMQAIIEAFHAIQTGMAERAVVVAYDVATEPQALYYYDKLGVISHNDLKPFDEQHNGTILAEGAAAMVLESERSAQERGARCFGEVLGGKSTSEAQGLFTLDETGTPLADLVDSAIKDHQIDKDDIGMVVAHGNGNVKSDVSEARAIQSLFTDEIPVTGFKWSMGHTVCASGLIDAVMASYALRERIVPGIANLSKPAPECTSLQLSSSHQDMTSTQNTALILNRGFSSMNACLFIKSYA